MLRAMNDQRFGAAIRALRRRRRWRQSDLAEMASVPQSTISDIERGHVAEQQVGTLRRVCAPLDARVEFDLWWRGGALDRLLDARHARVGDRVVGVQIEDGWQTLAEVTFAEFRETGSIDVLGVRRDLLAAVIHEIKSEVTSVEETNRRFDVKIRLAPTIVRKTFGFTPDILGAVLVLPDDTTARRRVAEHEATFRTRYPARGWEVRRWLRQPSGSLRGLWFLSDIARGDATRRLVTPTRVRLPRRTGESASDRPRRYAVEELERQAGFSEL
jgi:transcriptional regulator with XRE-family HTH domain